MTIWIDADAAPREVKELVFRAAKRLAVPAVLVANQRLQPPPGNPQVTAVWVDGGADVADQYIADHAALGDLVVTQDIPLAAILVREVLAYPDWVEPWRALARFAVTDPNTAMRLVKALG